MTRDFNLKVFKPSELVLDVDIKEINITGKEGNFGMLPKHIDYVSSFDSSIIKYKDLEDKYHYVAVNEGSVIKYGSKVRVSVYNAVFGDDLVAIKTKLENMEAQKLGVEREIAKNLKNLELLILNNLAKIK